MRWILAATVFSLTLLGQTAHAHYYDGSDLNGWMRDIELFQAGKGGEKEAVSFGIFQGYVMGASDADDTLRATCIPTSVTVGQITSIVSKYIRANPEQWQVSASVLVNRALRPVFPCRK